jgi:hypothetical protein
MRVLGHIAGLALMVFTIGCTSHGHPIINVENALVPTAPGKTHSTDDVQKAILRAGPMSGWVIQPEQPGRLVGRTAFGSGDRHVAIVSITHDAKSYSIAYRDSVNLAAQPAENKIHRAYNEKVANLDRAIRNELMQVKP